MAPGAVSGSEAGKGRDARPSMVDVATLAGVSHQTVSRVINGGEKVAPATLERVLAAIEQLGYRPNSVARALVTRRTGVIGIITTTSNYFGPSSMLLAIEVSARAAGYFPGVAPIEASSPAALRTAVDHFLGLSAEALIILAPIVDMVEDLACLAVPVPVIAVTSPEIARVAGALCVGVDQSEGARLAVRHLLELGHTDIAHIPGPVDWFEGRTREDEWRRVMAGAGLRVREPRERGWDAAVGYEAGMGFVRDGVPTAVFAGNDDVALGLVHALHESGLDVPGDVSVVGFDDTPGSRFYIPRLTTVRQDFAELGRTVVDTMIAAIDGAAPGDPVLLPTHLVVRESTAPPRTV